MKSGGQISETIAPASRPAGGLSSFGRVTLSRALQSVLVVPLTTNLDRARLAGTALIEAQENGLSQTSVALAFQMRAIPKAFLRERIRNLTEQAFGELELATDEAIGRVESDSE